MKVTTKLKQLNLTGIPKVTAEATIAYIQSLEKQLSKINKLRAQGKLIELPAAPNSIYYSVCPYFEQYHCTNCSNVCQSIVTTPKQYTFNSIEEILKLSPQIGRTIFLTLSSATKTKKSSNYVPRSQLDEAKLSRLRQADKDYYQLHKEEVNKKDRDNYHKLHPNARYYKKRVNAHQVSMEEVLANGLVNS